MKSKQAPSDPKQTSGEKRPGVTQTTGEPSCVTRLPMRRLSRIEPDSPEAKQIAEATIPVRTAPDILDVARMGGMPESIKPYELACRKKDGSIYATAHGNSTATVTYYATIGYGKVIDAARAYRAEHADADAYEITTAIKHLDFFGEDWTEKNIVHSARNGAELSAEMRDIAIENVPEVKRWGVTPPTPVETTERGAASVPPKNRFAKEGETWAISFAGEVCKLPAPMIGLDYILVLLQNPGVEMRALELQTVLAAAGSRPASKCAADSITEDAEGDTEDEGNRSSSSQLDFIRSEYSDYPATLKCKARMLELEELTTRALEIGDKQKAEDWQKEYDKIDSHLNRSRNVRGLPRVFPGENEQARTSITKALRRAYTKIRLQAPKTADHLRSQIKTGAKLVYQDGSTSWEL